MRKLAILGAGSVFLALGAAAEFARLVLLMLVMKAAARVGKDHRAASKAQVAVVIYSIINGVIPLLLFLFVVVLVESASGGRGGGGSGRGYDTLGRVMMVLWILAHTGALVMPAVAGNDARAALARRRG